MLTRQLTLTSTIYDKNVSLLKIQLKFIKNTMELYYGNHNFEPQPSHSP